MITYFISFVNTIIFLCYNEYNHFVNLCEKGLLFMKICPLCKTKYSDDAQYCVKDKILLEKLPDKKEKEDVPFEPKRIIKVCIYTCVFIGFIMLLYYILGTWGR